MASVIRGSDNFDSASSAVNAWVVFNGTGTVSVYTSSNMSSVTDNGTGQYTANWSPTLPSSNYCALATSGNEGLATRSSSRLAASWAVANTDGNYSLRDSDNISMSATAG